ncbi:MAG: class I tRNA ligase family protein, partial [Chloroflexi bacterium]|nr:class I tRNA ligase family protein [Chloroflexota bacterium]
RLYVWFEAVIGYFSAAVEWAGDDEAKWRAFWQGDDVKSYYFIGKDNIPFHTIIWPAMLLGYREDVGASDRYNLPYDVPANEFLSLEGQKFSTSQNWAVWLPDYLERYQPDPLRYYLSANMPETGDADFSWTEFVRRNNDELVATYGNLVHRVLTLAYRNFDRQVPAPATLDALSQHLLEAAERALAEVEKSLALCHFRMAIGLAMGLAREANRYLDLRAPWRTLREDRGETATTLWVSLSIINCLKLLLYPFLPFSSEKLHAALGFETPLQQEGWRWKATADFMPPGQLLQEPQPLFVKLDDKVVAEEVARLDLQRAKR